MSAVAPPTSDYSCCTYAIDGQLSCGGACAVKPSAKVLPSGYPHKAAVGGSAPKVSHAKPPVVVRETYVDVPALAGIKNVRSALSSFSANDDVTEKYAQWTP